MLTNLFYYDLYKPYIFKNEKITSKVPVSYSKTEHSKSDTSNSGSSEVESENEYSFFLNKSFKNEIVDYAETISLDLNSIKNSAKNVINNTGSLLFNFGATKEKIKKSLSDFAKKYNAYNNFAKRNNRQSPLLSTFSDSLKFRVSDNFDCLAKLGFSDVSTKTEGTSDEGLSDKPIEKISFDEEYFDSLSQKNISENLSPLKEFCQSIYDDTCEIMTVPMEEHMNFRNLDYYYNYIFANNSSKSHNTVKIIETGMLVDISL